MENKPFGMVIKGIAGIILSACIGVILLCAVYCLPVDKINQNVKRSLPVFETEGSYPALSNKYTSILDNYTDALMLLKARYSGDESILNKAMMVFHKSNTIEATSPVESLLIDEEENDEKTSYTRYWHGYLVVLKPLLYFFDYSMIRNINMVMQSVITLILLYVMLHRNLKKYILPYIISVLMIAPLANAKSLQFSTIYYIYSLGSIILIAKNEFWVYRKRYLYYFLFIGCCTSFFDFLTYPLVTFGVPMTFYFCMNGTQKKSNFLEFVKCLFFWGMGYVGMWGCKWIFASVLTENDIITETIHFIKLRSSNTDFEGNTISKIETIYKNVEAFFNTPIKNILLLYMAFMLIGILAWVCLEKRNAVNTIIDKTVKYSCIAILPFIWFVGAQNHSHLHYWFTYKILIITVFPLCCMITEILQTAQYTLVIHLKSWIWSCVVICLLGFVCIMLLYLYKNKTSLEIIQNIGSEGKLLFEGRYSELYYWNDSFYYLIDKEYAQNRIFLHLYTLDEDYVGDGEGFINRDFDFSEFELESYLWQPVKVACVPCEFDGNISKIETGQYNETGQLWNVKVDMEFAD